MSRSKSVDQAFNTDWGKYEQYAQSQGASPGMINALLTKNEGNLQSGLPGWGKSSFEVALSGAQGNPIVPEGAPGKPQGFLHSLEHFPGNVVSDLKNVGLGVSGLIDHAGKGVGDLLGSAYGAVTGNNAIRQAGWNDAERDALEPLRHGMENLGKTAAYSTKAPFDLLTGHLELSQQDLMNAANASNDSPLQIVPGMGYADAALLGQKSAVDSGKGISIKGALGDFGAIAAEHPLLTAMQAAPAVGAIGDVGKALEATRAGDILDVVKPKSIPVSAAEESRLAVEREKFGIKSSDIHTLEEMKASKPKLGRVADLRVQATSAALQKLSSAKVAEDGLNYRLAEAELLRDPNNPASIERFKDTLKTMSPTSKVIHYASKGPLRGAYHSFIDHLGQRAAAEAIIDRMSLSEAYKRTARLGGAASSRASRRFEDVHDDFIKEHMKSLREAGMDEVTPEQMQRALDKVRTSSWAELFSDPNASPYEKALAQSFQDTENIIQETLIPSGDLKMAKDPYNEQKLVWSKDERGVNRILGLEPRIREINNTIKELAAQTKSGSLVIDAGAALNAVVREASNAIDDAQKILTDEISGARKQTLNALAVQSRTQADALTTISKEFDKINRGSIAAKAKATTGFQETLQESYNLLGIITDNFPTSDIQQIAEDIANKKMDIGQMRSTLDQVNKSISQVIDKIKQSDQTPTGRFINKLAGDHTKLTVMRSKLDRIRADIKEIEGRTTVAGREMSSATQRAGQRLAENARSVEKSFEYLNHINGAIKEAVDKGATELQSSIERNRAGSDEIKAHINRMSQLQNTSQKVAIKRTLGHASVIISKLEEYANQGDIGKAVELMRKNKSTIIPADKSMISATKDIPELADSFRKLSDMRDMLLDRHSQLNRTLVLIHTANRMGHLWDTLLRNHPPATYKEMESVMFRRSIDATLETKLNNLKILAHNTPDVPEMVQEASSKAMDAFIEHHQFGSMMAIRKVNEVYDSFILKAQTQDIEDAAVAVDAEGSTLLLQSFKDDFAKALKDQMNDVKDHVSELRKQGIQPVWTGFVESKEKGSTFSMSVFNDALKEPTMDVAKSKTRMRVREGESDPTFLIPHALWQMEMNQEYRGLMGRIAAREGKTLSQAESEAKALGIYSDDYIKQHFYAYKDGALKRLPDNMKREYDSNTILISAGTVDRIRKIAKQYQTDVPGFISKVFKAPTKVMKMNLFTTPRFIVHMQTAAMLTLMSEESGAASPMALWRGMMKFKNGEMPPALDFSDNAVLDRFMVDHAGGLSNYYRGKSLGNIASQTIRKVDHAFDWYMDKCVGMVINSQRIALYDHVLNRMLNNGADTTVAEEMAADKVAETLGSMHDMTGMERKIATYAFPFLHWTKHIVSFMLNMPDRSPYKAGLLGAWSNYFENSWNYQYNPTFAYNLYLGTPDANGNITTVNLRNLNPLRLPQTLFSVTGFASMLSPVVQIGISNIDPSILGGSLLGSGNYDSVVNIDALTGTTSTAPAKPTGLEDLGAVLPTFGNVAGQLQDQTSYLRYLSRTNPSEFRSQVWSSLGFPWIPYKTNLIQARASRELSFYYQLRSQVQAAMSQPDFNSPLWDKLMQYKMVPLAYGNTASGWFMSPQALKTYAQQVVAQAGGNVPPDIVMNVPGPMSL